MQLCCRNAQHQNKPIRSICVEQYCPYARPSCFLCEKHIHYKHILTSIDVQDLDEWYLKEQRKIIEINKQLKLMIENFTSLMQTSNIVLNKYNNIYNMNFAELNDVVNFSLKFNKIFEYWVKNLWAFPINCKLDIDEINKLSIFTKQDQKQEQMIFQYQNQQQYINLYTELGNQLKIERNYSEAIIQFDKALQLNGKDEEILLLKGECLYEQKNYAQSLGILSDLLYHSPENIKALELVIKINEKLQNYEKVYNYYVILTKIEPDNKHYQERSTFYKFQLEELQINQIANNNLIENEIEVNQLQRDNYDELKNQDIQ